MASAWGNLQPDVQAAIRERVSQVGDDEVEARIRRDDKGRVLFRLFGGTTDSYAEMTLQGEEFAVGPPPPQEVVLISPSEFDYEPEITADDLDMATPIDMKVAPLRSYFVHDPGAHDEGESAAPNPTLPPVVDHRPRQSPIKNQEKRGTCVSHASMALLETAANIPDDLSEQYTHWKFCEINDKPHDEDFGFRTTDAAVWLSRRDVRVCTEQDWPYMPTLDAIKAAMADGAFVPPRAARANLQYGYGSYKLITDLGAEGESIKNTRFLESLLALGYDIVVGVWASWADERNPDVLPPLLDSQGNPIGRGGHAMLIVGYDRPNQYFIFKNSWGLGWGHAGYGYFSYDFVRSCSKYGFTVSSFEPPPGPGVD